MRWILSGLNIDLKNHMDQFSGTVNSGLPRRIATPPSDLLREVLAPGR